MGKPWLILCVSLLWGWFGHAGDVRPRVLKRLPHDPGAFTQGLLIDGDVWLESTGQYGASELREVSRATGQVLRRAPMPEHFFGEGLAQVGNKLYQLTWQAGVCRVVDRSSFQVMKTLQYVGEGWGLTADGKFLYLSDGTSVIRVLDPVNFRVVRKIQVREAGRPVVDLNELEWIGGEIWANVWQTSRIVRIDPDTGAVLGGLDLSHLPLAMDQWRGQDVLNGIAVDPQTGEIWITGKYWRALYCIAWPGDEEDE